jgi:anti-anti-sigma factor
MPEDAYRAPAGEGRPAVSAGPAAGAPRLATADVRAEGQRIRVAVTGELDLSADGRIGDDLCATLRDSAQGIDLDLGAVRFVDCSGLNALLGLRRQALEQGKTVVIRSSSPVVDRLLQLTGADGLFD